MTPQPAPGPAVGRAADVSVVIVSFNSAAWLPGCLESVLASSGVALEVVVVDNGSTDGSAALVRDRYPRVTVLENTDNRGFAAANNHALRRASAPTWLLLNPDTRVGPDTVRRLREALRSADDIGIVGPTVLNGDGSLQSCGYWYPTLVGEIRLSRNVNRLVKRWMGEARPAPDPRVASDVDWVDGCCLMVRRRVAEQIGLLDEQFFLYAEELDWCRSARRRGWRVRTVPEASMWHFQGKSTEQVKARALGLLVETRLRYYHKQDGLPTALAVAAVYALGCARRWRAEPEKSAAKLAGVRHWLARARRGDGVARVPRLDEAP